MKTKTQHEDPITDWSNYWALGHLTSLPNAYTKNYEGEFHEFWTHVFHKLPDDAEILDVCSGNGSIALMSKSFSDEKHRNFAITACDAARIKVRELGNLHPELANQLSGITMLSRTPLNTLTLAENSRDLITSQFGIEYTPWSESASIVARLLKPGGLFAMVSHTVESTIVTQMRYQQADLEFLTGLKLFTAPVKRPNSLSAQHKWLTLVEETLNKIYTRFQANRESLILKDIGEQLESIKQQGMGQFNKAHSRFAGLAKQVQISKVTATDVILMANRIESAPNWYNTFQEAGLALFEQRDIRYKTGEIAASAFIFRAH